MTTAAQSYSYGFDQPGSTEFTAQSFSSPTFHHDKMPNQFSGAQQYSAPQYGGYNQQAAPLNSSSSLPAPQVPQYVSVPNPAAISKGVAEPQISSGRKMDIRVRDLSFTVNVEANKVKETKVILKNVNLNISSGKLTVLMGASGAGKTSLMSALAGDVGSGTVYGSVELNGAVVDASKLKKMSAYVFQDDVILGTMTVREAITMSARLRLPASMPDAEKLRKVEEVIRILHLTDCADGLIGSALVKGVSGGERKRCSVGMELVTDPLVLFLDEPTTGLDTFTALSLTSTLKQLAATGRTVVSTMHQPSSEIFHLFDDLILLGRGEVLYAGPAEDSVQYFSSIGYPCPRYTNPADYFFVSVINDESGKVSRDIRNSELNSAWARHKAQRPPQLEQQPGTDVSKLQNEPLPGFGTQFSLLFGRSTKNQLRNPLILRGRFGQTMVLAIIVGLIYQRLHFDQRSIQDRQGFLFFLAVNSVFAYAMGTVSTFHSERNVLIREYRSHMYSLPAYFAAKVTSELPMLVFFPFVYICIIYWMVGLQQNAAKFFINYLVILFMAAAGQGIGTLVSALATSPAQGLQILPMFLMPLMIFSGFMINDNSIPVYFIWVKFLSPMKYGFTALCKNEFFGLEFTCNGASCLSSGAAVLENMGFMDELTITENIVVIGCFYIGLNILGYFSLWKIGNKQSTAKYVSTPLAIVGDTTTAVIMPQK